MKVVAFITEYAAVDRIIGHLKLTFVAEKPTSIRGKDYLLYARGSVDADLFRKECREERKSKFLSPIPDGKTVVDAGHVDTAIKERFERVSLIEDKIQEMIDEGSILIDTQGAVVGQVNDLVDKEIERLARVAKDAGEEKDAKKD